MMQIDDVFARRMREVRKAQGMGQADLAAKVGLTFNQVSRIELGKRKASVGEAYAIAVALDTLLREMLVEPCDHDWGPWHDWDRGKGRKCSTCGAVESVMDGQTLRSYVRGGPLYNC